MKKIDFKLEKNNDIVIYERNIHSINTKNKTTFIINGIKYTYENNIFKRETDEELIKINFDLEKCTITLKEQKVSLNLNIKVIENKKTDNEILLKYKIETEENIINKITIKYI